MNDDKKIDWISFGTCVALLLGICIPLAAFPGKGGAVLPPLISARSIAAASPTR